MIIYVAHALHSKTATYYLQRSFATLQNAFTLRVHLKARPGTLGVPEGGELTLTKARPFCLRNESLCPVTAARARAGAHAAAVSDGGSPERDCLCGLQSAATGCGTQSQPPLVSVTTSTWAQCVGDSFEPDAPCLQNQRPIYCPAVAAAPPKPLRVPLRFSLLGPPLGWERVFHIGYTTSLAG